MKIEMTQKEDEEVARLVKWMTSNHISGSVISISKLWAIHENVNHDYNFYRKMSHLLNIAELKSEIESEWVTSKRPIKEKVYKVLPKSDRKQPESNTQQEKRSTEVYQLDSRMILDLTRSGVEEKRGILDLYRGFK